MFSIVFMRSSGALFQLHTIDIGRAGHLCDSDSDSSYCPCSAVINQADATRKREMCRVVVGGRVGGEGENFVEDGSWHVSDRGRGGGVG